MEGEGTDKKLMYKWMDKYFIYKLVDKWKGKGTDVQMDGQESLYISPVTTGFVHPFNLMHFVDKWT